MTRGIFLSISVFGGLSILAILLSVLIRRRYSKVPDTPIQLIPRILDIIGLAPTDTFIDLGAGDFRIVKSASLSCQSSGIELSPLHLMYAKFRRPKGARKKYNVMAGNLLSHNLEKFNVLYVNIDPDLMKCLFPLQSPSNNKKRVYILNREIVGSKYTSRHDLDEKNTLYEYHF